MVLTKVHSGELVPGRSTVVESSSGNLAIGLAQACSYHGIKLVCVVDAKTTGHNLAILRAYGVTVEVVTTPDPDTGEFAGSSVLNEFSNPVQFICAQIGAIENATADETSKLCSQYLGPALRLLNFNYMPIPFNPFLAKSASP